VLQRLATDMQHFSGDSLRPHSLSTTVTVDEREDLRGIAGEDFQHRNGGLPRAVGLHSESELLSDQRHLVHYDLFCDLFVVGMYPRYRDVPINLAKAVIFSESRKAHPR